MTGWALFFTALGVAEITLEFMKLLAWAEGEKK